VTLQGLHFAEYAEYDVLVGGIRVNGRGVFRTVLVNETAGLLFSVAFAEVCAQQPHGTPPWVGGCACRRFL
jgi:hypothetical protein